ncbi:hypothetical protein N9F40_01240 [bacterium]|nr:hypothetical protein [bacterium]
MAHDEAARAAAARVSARDVHRSLREPANEVQDAAATRIAEAARAAEPLLDMKQRTTRDDPEGFMETFFRASRLHYIGTWKHRYEAFLEEMPVPPKLGSSKSRCVMHVDMDCFFAAVAMLGRPELKDLPVAVSWSSGAKGAGELSSCNYKAREFGLKAGGRIADAIKLCPNLVVMPYEFEKYSKVALEVYRVLHSITPHVMGVSVDEAYLDVTDVLNGLNNQGKERDPSSLAEEIRQKIKNETGCVASVGIGPNRLVARLATKHAKPDGVFIVNNGNEKEYVASLPVTELPGVGRGALEKLKSVFDDSYSPIMCKNITSTPVDKLKKTLGPKSGGALRDACLGIDNRVWVSRPPRKSVGAQVTWGVRFDAAAEAVAFAEKLVTEVSERSLKLKVKGRCLTLKVLRAVANVPDGMRKGNIGHGVCDHLTRSVTLSSLTNEAKVLKREVAQILAKLDIPATEIRGMGVQLSKLDCDPKSSKMTLFSGRVGVKTAPAGRQKEWTERDEKSKKRYAEWFGTPGGSNADTTPTKPKPATPDKKRVSPRGKANAYAVALGGGGVATSFARESVPESTSSAKRMRSSQTEDDDARDDDANGTDTEDDLEDVKKSTKDFHDPHIALRQAHASAARAHAFQVYSNEKLLDEQHSQAGLLLRDCEFFLLQSAEAAFQSDGPSAAASVVDAARRLARAQWTTPPVAFALCGGNGSKFERQQREFANVWIRACNRVEEEVVRVVLTQ